MRDSRLMMRAQVCHARAPETQNGHHVTTPDRLAAPDIVREELPDGSIVLHNRTALPDPLPDPLARWSDWLRHDGDAVFFSERVEDDICTATRADMDRLSDAYAASLVDAGCGPSARIAVVGGASIAHAALKIAALKANLVHVPLSPMLAESGFGRARLEHALSIAAPSLTIDMTGRISDAVSPSELLGSEPDRSFTPRESNLGHAAALYFTSGSTGEPKGVVVTRRMIASCQSAYALHWPFLADHPPALIDWLPWHHVFGGLDNFHKMIWNGGAYHAETPPGRDNMDAMATRIREVHPTVHINVPYGIDLLLDHLEHNHATRDALFDRLDAIFFAGAGMGAETWRRLRDTVAAGPHGENGAPLLVSGYGATESGSTMCLSHKPADITSEIGLPLPGHSLRLAPVDGVSEIRFKGPNVAPGYLGRDGAEPLPLDDDGYFRTGDLARPLFPGEPERGLCFDGRIVEDFKLTTGTRVKVGALRHALLAACAPYLQDVAIAGTGQNQLAVILFPAASALHALSPKELAAYFQGSLATHNSQQPGSSTAIARAAISTTPPDRDKGEINDKGHLVQARCLANRAELVERLYANPPGDDILQPDIPKEAST